MTDVYPKAEVTALVLAGGKGRRMHGLDKGLLPFRGQPLVRHVADRLNSQAAKVLVSANRSADAYRTLGFTTLEDLRPGFLGPLAGIEAGLSRCDGGYLLVSPCDTPCIPMDLGQRLWQAMQDEQAQLAYACDSARDHYLHMLLPVTLADDLSRYLDQGGRAVRQWLADKPVARVAFPAAPFKNINDASQLV